jgi:two-component system cell cycle response regulator
VNRRERIVSSCLLAVVGALTAVHLAGMIAPKGGLKDFSVDWLYYAVIAASAMVILVRAALVRRDRLAWTLIGIGALSSAAAEIVYALAYANLKHPPYPSIADALWLAYYPFVAAGVLVLARRVVGRVGMSLALDGAIAATGAAALAAAFLGPSFVSYRHADTFELAVNLAYPVGDMLLLGGIAAAAVLIGWRRDFVFLALGLVATVVADLIYVHQSATTGYVGGTVLDAGWTVSAALIAFAAWQQVRATAPSPVPQARSVALPTLIALSAVGLTTYDHFEAVPDISLVLASATLVLAMLRLLIAFAENGRLLSTARGHALTDALTGIGNRRLLMDDLGEAVAEANHGEREYVLAIYDLDGFKSYNDTFGHAAGDHLLRRMGMELGASVQGRGVAYRLGGDEFCVLAPIRPHKPASLLASARAALSEDGEGFSITASLGAAQIPAEARSPEDALRLADRRLYAEKGRSPRSFETQARDLLLGVLREREPKLEAHMEGVGALTAELARRRGITGEERELIGRAADLHDIGKMAIPDEILNKPGPLDDAEWELMRTHTLIGERMLGSSPALGPVAKLVRSSHERWDGTGYPDGLAGEDIPLGARMIAICDAFEAMTEMRPYREPMSINDALAELRRSAGSQFDPELVELFVEVISARADRPAVSART